MQELLKAVEPSLAVAFGKEYYRIRDDGAVQLELPLSFAKSLAEGLLRQCQEKENELKAAISQ